MKIGSLEKLSIVLEIFKNTLETDVSEWFK